MTQKTTICLNEPLELACSELLTMFGIEHEFMCELSESSLTSTDEINIHIGLTQGLKGNVVVELPEKAALLIVSGMMGGMEFAEFDEMAQSGISEFTNMLMGNALGKVASEELIDISPPTLAIGKDVYLMISRAEAKKIFFKIGDTKFSIAYCIE